jgi:hypothetical protein
LDNKTALFPLEICYIHKIDRDHMNSLARIGGRLTISGPSTGPFKGPNDRTDNANGKYLGAVISIIDPLALDSITLPAIALSVITTSALELGD